VNGYDVGYVGDLERMPPQDVAAEQDVLGACMMSRRALDEARAVIDRARDEGAESARPMLMDWLATQGE
jgi:hypothetical protein